MTTHNETACLMRAKLFAPLPAAARAQLGQVAVHRQFFPRGSVIRQPGEAAAGMLVIDDGQAKVTQLAETGKERVLVVLTTGDVLGQEFLFSAEPPRDFVTAVTDTWVCGIRRHDFQALLTKTPALALTMLNDFGQQLLATEKTLVRRDLLSAQERLLAYLTDLSATQGRAQVTLPVKKKELASLLSVTPETLSRQLAALVKRGAISVTGRQITVHDGNPGRL